MRERNLIVGPDDDISAGELQSRLSNRLQLGHGFKLIAGATLISVPEQGRVYAVAAALSPTNWQVVYEQRVCSPYEAAKTSRLRVFSEGRVLVDVLSRLPGSPDLIFVDGDGILGPGGFGTAAYVGYTFEVPTVGVSRELPEGYPRSSNKVGPTTRGASQALVDAHTREQRGHLVFLQDHQDPVYVSPGNCISVRESLSAVLRCAPWHAMPEPLRHVRERAQQFQERSRTDSRV